MIPEHYVGVLDPWAELSKHPSLKHLCSYFKGKDCRSHRLSVRPDFKSHKAYLSPHEVGYETAFHQVIDQVGAFPRDIITKTSLKDVQTRSGEWGARIPDDLMQGLQASEPLLDSDNDGMSDLWEKDNNLDPNDAGDQHKIMPSGYSAIEQYINDLADMIVK